MPEFLEGTLKRKELLNRTFDVIVIGAGVSGSTIALELSKQKLSCLCIEAGKKFKSKNFPTSEIDSNSQLYWGGGIEFNSETSIGFLRPKVVGGGSIVNQALMDRFDQDVFDRWNRVAGDEIFDDTELSSWYKKAEDELVIQEIPAQYRNKNAHIFKTGFEKNGYKWAPLNRAQSNCGYEEGNDCIECLAGCRRDSKQGMNVNILPKAMINGVNLISEHEVLEVLEAKERVEVICRNRRDESVIFRAKLLVLAAGAIGNSKLLLQSKNQQLSMNNVGKRFYTHPQFMSLALYDEEINAHKGPFQSLKSKDEGFKEAGFKLENVFAPPVGLSMLLPGIGTTHQKLMKKITRMACIEVAIRDTVAGSIKLNKGKVQIEKRIIGEDVLKKKNGQRAIENIFNSTGALEIFHGKMGIGLHLMGGLSIGKNAIDSVVDQKFKLHGSNRIFAADSSVFPMSSGINPSLTIMALSKKASSLILEQL